MTYLATFAAAVVLVLAAMAGLGWAAHRAGHLVVMDFRQSGLVILEYRGNGRFRLIGTRHVPMAVLRFAGRSIVARLPRVGRDRRFFPGRAPAAPARLAPH
jgi:hypothetical protein